MEKRKRQPNYLLARELLIEIIHKEKYQVGETIPSVTKLTERLGLARITIQQALKMLAEEDILNNIPGSGCYIKNLPSVITTASDTVSDEWNYLAGPGGTPSPKRIKIALLPEAPEHVALWEKVFSDYSDSHKDVQLELVRLDFPALLFNHKLLAGIDLFQVPAFLLPFFVKSGHLFDLTELGGLELPPDSFYKGFIQGASYAGKIHGVPVVTAGICQYYNKKYESIVNDLFPVKGFWDHMEKLGKLSKDVKFKDFESLITNAESLFTLSMLVNAEDSPSYDDMKNFESPEFAKFIKHFG